MPLLYPLQYPISWHATRNHASTEDQVLEFRYVIFLPDANYIEMIDARKYNSPLPTPRTRSVLGPQDARTGMNSDKHLSTLAIRLTD